MSFKSPFPPDVRMVIDSMQPYSKKLLDFRMQRDPGDETSHFEGGPLAELSKGYADLPAFALAIPTKRPVPRLIGLVGHFGSGKDTVGALLAPFGYARVALADGVREVARALGWDGSKEELPACPTCGMVRGRTLLQRIGTEGVRATLGDDSWIRAADLKVAKLDKAVVTDVRFLNEAAWVRSRGGVVWRVTRPGHQGNGHVSETEMAEIHADQELANTGDLIDLEETVRLLL